jgi:hypothetical protein
MEWVAEGLALCFIGFLVFIVTLLAPDDTAADIVYLSSAGMLVLMAAWTLATGARTSIVPIKICPLVKTGVGVLFISAVFI